MNVSKVYVSRGRSLRKQNYIYRDITTYENFILIRDETVVARRC